MLDLLTPADCCYVLAGCGLSATRVQPVRGSFVSAVFTAFTAKQKTKKDSCCLHSHTVENTGVGAAWIVDMFYQVHKSKLRQ